MMQSRKLTRDIRAVGALTLMALALAGCGMRGNLEYPNETKQGDNGGQNDKAAPTATATADSGQGKPEGAAPKPHKGFILDGLIR